MYVATLSSSNLRCKDWQAGRSSTGAGLRGGVRSGNQHLICAGAREADVYETASVMRPRDPPVHSP